MEQIVGKCLKRELLSSDNENKREKKCKRRRLSLAVMLFLNSRPHHSSMFSLSTSPHYDILQRCHYLV
jgi:hypothetical protein